MEKIIIKIDIVGGTVKIINNGKITQLRINNEQK